MHSDATRTEPEWVTHAVFWHVYPLGFTGADTTGIRRDPGAGFARLTGWLDYAITLGASALLLAPIFSSSSHGYDTLDYFSIDERLGSIEEFDDFLAAAHARGIRVVLDGVFNHIGRDSTLLAKHPELFRRAGDDFAVFEGHRHLVAFDHERDEVAEYVSRVMRHWLSRGVDGWRLDAAYAVPTSFWSRVIAPLREEFPDSYFLGEVIHGDYQAFVAQSGVDSVTQYELWKAIWSSLNDGNFFELSWALTRHNELLTHYVPQTFIGNHDVTRIASILKDEHHLAHALVLLFTLGGTPSVYYGDEQGFRGIKEERIGGDDEVRPQFPDNPSELSGLGAGVLRLHQDLIGLRRRHPWLHRAHTEIVELANEFLVYDVRYDSQRLRVVLNLNERTRQIDTDGLHTVLGSGGEMPGKSWSILG